MDEPSAPVSSRQRLSSQLRSRTGGHAAITVAGGFAGQLPVLVSGIIVARVLGVENRGHLALLWVVAVIFGFVGATGLPSAVTFWVARDPKLCRPLARVVVKAAAVQVIVATLVQGLVLLVVLGGDQPTVKASGLISLVVVPAMIAVMYGMAFLQGLQRFASWTAIRLLPATSYTVAALILDWAGAGDLLTITAAWAGSFVLAAFAAVWRAAKTCPPQAQRGAPDFRELQRFGARAFLGAASPTDTLQLDQALVGLVISSRALGLYAVANAFTNLPSLVAQSVGYVAYPDVARRADPRAGRRAMWMWGGVTALGCAAIVAVLELAAGWLVPLLFGNAYAGAVGLVRLLLAASFLVSVRRTLADGARGAGYPGLGSVAEIASSITLLPAMAVAATTFGVDGVAVALIGAGLVGFGVLLVGLAKGSAKLRRAAQAAALKQTAGADPSVLSELSP